jgi:hypothetical protein
LVNISLLSKWKWKLLSCENELWKEIVVARYGKDVMGKRVLGEVDVTRWGSSWWRDLCLIDKDSAWFNNAIGKRVGNGNLTSFWNEHWIGDQTLRQRFPRLFGISMHRDDMIGNMGSWVDGDWQWELQWRRRFFAWEDEQYREFLEIIAPFRPSDDHDRWLWLGDSVQGFSANSAYLLLVAEFIPPVLGDPVMGFVFKYLWKCGAPSKVCAFSWQLLLDRISTKDNLLKRRILQVQHGQCVMCSVLPESACHLFLHCKVAAKVWYDMVRWLGFTIILPHNIPSSVATLIHRARNKREKIGLCLIWNAFVWVLWSVRNDVIFNNGAVYNDEIADQVKLLSWKWFIARVSKGPILLYEWKWSPLDCMMR